MKFSIFCLLITITISLAYEKFRVTNSHWDCSLSDLKDSEYKNCLSKFLKKNAKKQDHEMLEEISLEYVKTLNKSQLNKEDIQTGLDKIEKYVNAWKENMFMKLIEIYKIEYDNDFLKEMLNDPDFYGLNYDSYKIMTFKFEDEHVEEQKEADNKKEDL